MNKIAIVQLPADNTPTQSEFKNMHGFWTPPEFVREFWATAAIIHFSDEADYRKKADEIAASYLAVVRTFYSENAL